MKDTIELSNKDDGLRLGIVVKRNEMEIHEHAVFVGRCLYPIGLIYDKIDALDKIEDNETSVKAVMQSNSCSTIEEAKRIIERQLEERFENVFSALDEYGDNAVKDVLFRPSYNRRQLYYKGESLGFDGMELDRHSGVRKMTVDIAWKYVTRGCWWAS